MFIIETENLVKKYGKHAAVDNVSLKVGEGEVFGLLGPNGAGKSTTISLICGLLNPTAGNVKLFGKNVAEAKSMLGFVPQNIALYDTFTAYENVKFFGELYGLSGKQLESNIIDALKFVELLDVKRKKAKTFSGGMLRRLNIACALVHHPKVIIMDEPTVGIDPQSRNHILESVRRLNENGVTVIYTTHYMEEIEAICNKIAIMDHGKIIAQGSKKELKDLINDKTSLRVVVDDGFKLDVNEIKGINGVINVDAQENVIEIASKKEVENLNLIIDNILKKNTKIRDIGYKEVTLETVFLSLTGRKLRD